MASRLGRGQMDLLLGRFPLSSRGRGELVSTSDRKADHRAANHESKSPRLGGDKRSHARRGTRPTARQSAPAMTPCAKSLLAFFRPHRVEASALSLPRWSNGLASHRLDRLFGRLSIAQATARLSERSAYPTYLSSPRGGRSQHDSFVRPTWASRHARPY